MNKIQKAAYELGEMYDLASQSSPMHSLSPLTKLFITVIYIVAVVSLDKYDLSGVVVMVLYPVIMFQISGIPVRTCFYKLRIVLPLVMAVGLFNPVFDRIALLTIGTVSVSGGVVSMVTLMLKGIFCLMASFLLMATTTIDSLCAALRKLHVPKLIVTLLLLTFRYVGVMMDELSVMTDAYHLRAPRQKGIHYRAWGSFLGQLLLRSMDRAEELYSSMQLRGFTGEFYYAETARFGLRDAVWLVVCLGCIALLRFVDIARLLGGVFIGR